MNDVSSEATADVLALGPDLGFNEAEALKLELLRRFEASRPLRIDATHVRRVTTSAMQVLLSFALEEQKHGRAIAWLGTSTVFLEATRLLGLQSHLGIAQR